MKTSRADMLRDVDLSTLLIAERTMDRDARRVQSDLAAVRREIRRRKRDERASVPAGRAGEPK
jgi:hypothetical protein